MVIDYFEITSNDGKLLRKSHYKLSNSSSLAMVRSKTWNSPTCLFD